MENMPTVKQQKIYTGELLDDIRHVNDATREGIKRADSHLQRCICETTLPAAVANTLLDEISTHLGQLTAEVELNEKAIHLLQFKQKSKKKIKNNFSLKVGNSQTVNLRFTASQLAQNKNLLPLESSVNGISYLWSGANPEIQFTFSLDRNAALEMQIRLFALIKPEYSKKLKVLIDGNQVKHLFGLNDSLFVVSCVLPPSNKTTQTEVKIVLPGTHSPTELGRSPDERILGIAINEIRFSKPESGFAHLLKWLRLKS